MQDTLKVDKGVAGTVMLVALALATPFFIVFGSLSDRVGRKKVMMAGMVLGAVGFIPMFNLLTMAAGYDAVAKTSPNPNVPMLIAAVFVMVLFVTMVYGPIAAFLIELFPTRIRYSSMSVPYHIGNGIFGGLVPFISTALVASSGNIYAGLWYPVGVAAATFIIGSLFLKEREHETTDPLPG